jgi:UDP-N-acetylmuramyl tripeptide synthase
VDTTREKWQKSLSAQPKETVLIANADDPQISFIAQNFKGKVIYFGVNEKKLNLPEIAHVADIKYCLNCGEELNYQTILSSHMGHYSCSKCTFSRPSPTVSASNLRFYPDFSTSLKLTLNSQLSTFNYKLPGLYNVYNILASISVGDQLKINQKEIKKAIFNFSAAFGRSEQVSIQGKIAKIFLIKNPTGANEVLRVLALKDKINLFVALNDNIADGRDVSWVWDTNWEVLSAKLKSVTVSGIRALDMATRLKYAGFRLSKNRICEDIPYSLNFTLNYLNSHESLIILTTYTALLEIKKEISRQNKGSKWHED